MTIEPTGDLFGHKPPPQTIVRLDRGIDRSQPCCAPFAIIQAGQGQHAAELRCAGCGKHRGWLPKLALDFLAETARRFGAPAESLVLRDSTIGDHVMEKKQYDNTNSGALFKNDEKESEKHPDYRGTIDIEGREFWLSGWIKTSKKGTKFMSLAVKPKEPPAPDKTKPIAEDMNDQIPF